MLNEEAHDVILIQVREATMDKQAVWLDDDAERCLKGGERNVYYLASWPGSRTHFTVIFIVIIHHHLIHLRQCLWLPPTV